VGAVGVNLGVDGWAGSWGLSSTGSQCSLDGEFGSRFDGGLSEIVPLEEISGIETCNGVARGFLGFRKGVDACSA
jgi:hypothetical protein